MPGLAGDYFADSLTYVCEHNEDGAMGVIVNRASDMTLLELLVQVGLQPDHKWVDTPVFEGGPVSPERGFVLHSEDADFESTAQLGHGVSLSTAVDVLDAIADERGPKRFIVALGYAGWGAGQLEEEMAANAWLNVAADTDLLFASDWENKAEQVARSIGVDMRLMSGRPGHA